MGVFKEIQKLILFLNTQNCFAYISATKYRSEALLYSKQLAGYPLSPHIKTIVSPLKVVFHQRSSSTEGCLPPKVVFLQRSSFINHNTLVDVIFVRTVNIPNLNLLPCLEVVFHQRPSSTEGHLPPKVIFHQRSAYTEGRLPPKVVFIIFLVFLLQYICGFCRANPLYALSTKPLFKKVSKPKISTL